MLLLSKFISVYCVPPGEPSEFRIVVLLHLLCACRPSKFSLRGFQPFGAAIQPVFYFAPEEPRSCFIVILVGIQSASGDASLG